MDKRPPAPVRYLVLLAVLVCLVCAVCARGQQPAAEPQPQADPAPQPQADPAVEPQADPAAEPQANPADSGPDAGVPRQANPPPDPPPKYFPATKAPGFLFR